MRALLLACLLVPSLAGPAYAHDADDPDIETVTASDKPLAGYTLTGYLRDPERDLRALLDVDLVVGQPFTDAVHKTLDARLGKLHYELEHLRERGQAGGRTWVTLEIHPKTAVRHIHISGNWPLFEDEILPRLHLRPGFEMQEDEKAQEEIFDIEARRLEEWLARQGYFQARVSIYAQPAAGAYELEVYVKIVKGPAYKLGKIKLTGNTSIEDGEIKRLLRPQNLSARIFRSLGWPDRFTKDGLNDSLQEIRALYQRNGFPGVRVKSTFDPATSFDRRSRTVSFTIDIKEKRKIDVAFEGNSAVPADKLAKVLTFNPEGSYDDVEVANSAAAVRRVYQAEGFYQTTVTWERVRLLPTFERILFYIQEGPRLRVRSISFRGNEALTAGELATRVTTKVDPGSSFSRLYKSGGYMTSSQLADDVAALVSHYQAKGFASARVTAAVVTDRRLFGEENDAEVGALAAAVTAEQLGGALHIRFTIHEGPRDVVETVSFFGNAQVNDRDLERATGLRPGQPFTGGKVEGDRDAIRRYYQERGYPYAQVKSTAVAGKQGAHSLRVRHEIVEGLAVHLGRVFVRGNFKTRRWVIADVLGIDEGDLVTLGRVRDGQDDLRQTGLFDSVHLDLLGLEEQREPVHALIEVQERHDNHGELEFAAGSASDNLAFASAGYALRNILGIGASTIVRGEFGTDIQYGRLDAKLPYWVMRRGTRIPLNLSLFGFLKNETTERFGDILQAGGGAELSRQLKHGWFVSFAYNFVYKALDQDLVRPAGANEDLEKTKIFVRIGSLLGSLALDRRTDAHGNPAIIAPSRGYRLSANASYAARWLLGNTDFIKLGVSGQFLSRVSKRILVTNGLRYDHGVPLTGSILPDTERFLAGGDTTVRGVEEDRLHTEVIRNPLFPGAGAEQFTVLPAGGNIRFLWNLDLQVQVWDKGFLGLPIASAIFLDTGLVTNSFANFQPNDLRHSLGIALARIVSPIGNFSIEYAIPLDPQLGDDPTGRFHFNLGFVF